MSEREDGTNSSDSTPPGALDWWGRYSDPVDDPSGDIEAADGGDASEPTRTDSRGTSAGWTPSGSDSRGADAHAATPKTPPDTTGRTSAPSGKALWGSWSAESAAPVKPSSSSARPSSAAAASSHRGKGASGGRGKGARKVASGGRGKGTRRVAASSTAPAGQPAAAPKRRRFGWWVLAAGVVAFATVLVVRSVTADPVRWSIDLATDHSLLAAFDGRVRVADSIDGQSTSPAAMSILYDSTVVPVSDDEQFRGLIALRESSGEPAWTYSVAGGLCASTDYPLVCLRVADDADAVPPADGSPGVTSSEPLVLDRLYPEDGEAGTSVETPLTSVRSLWVTQGGDLMVLGQPGVEGSELGMLSLLSGYDGEAEWSVDLAELEGAAELLGSSDGVTPGEQELRWVMLENGHVLLWLRPGVVLIDPSTGPVLDHVQSCDGPLAVENTYYCTTYEGDISPETATVHQYFATGREVETLPGVWTLMTESLVSDEPLLVMGNSRVPYDVARGATGSVVGSDPLTVDSEATAVGLNPRDVAAFGDDYSAVVVSSQDGLLSVVRPNGDYAAPWCEFGQPLSGLRGAEYVDVRPYGNTVIAWDSEPGQAMVMCSEYDDELVSSMESGVLEGLLRGADLFGEGDLLMAIRGSTVTAIDWDAATDEQSS